MRRSVLSIVATGLLAVGSISVAAAADIPARMPAKAPPAVYVPPFSWTGFYAGVNAGWGWTDGNGTLGAGPFTGPASTSGNGFLGGVQIGYNWQAGNIVFGLETDFQGSTGSGSASGSAGPVAFTGTAETPYFGTVRGRLGYAFDRNLIYITGGGAYGKSTLDGTLNTTGAFSSSATFWTWTIGAGYEAMLWDRWSAKAEYLYVGTPDSAPTPPGTTLSGDTDTHIVRVGLNYHF